MIFHGNRLLTYLFRKLGKMSQNVSSTAVVIGALKVNAQNNGNHNDKYLFYHLEKNAQGKN